MRLVTFSSALMSRSSCNLLGGEERGEVFEEDLVLGVFRRFTVDLVYLHQGKIPFPVFGGSNFSFYRIPCMQIEPPDLAW